MPKKTTNEAPQLVAATFDSLGAPRVDKVDATIADQYYEIGLNRDGNKYQLYHYFILHDDDTEEEYKVRNFAAWLTNKDGDKIAWVPSPDGRTLAGPDGVGLDDYIKLGRGTMLDELGDGDENYTEADFRGPYVACEARAGAPSQKNLPSSALQFVKEQMKKVLEADGLKMPHDGGGFFEHMVGYSFFWSLEEQEQKGSGGRKKNADGTEAQEFKVLVPMKFNSAPKAASSKKADAGKSTGAAAAKGSKPNGKASDDTAEMDTEIEEATIAILTETDEPMPKLGPGGFQAKIVEYFKEKYADDPKKRQAYVAGVIARGNSKWNFFLDDSRPWTVEGDTISL